VGVKAVRAVRASRIPSGLLRRQRRLLFLLYQRLGGIAPLIVRGRVRMYYQMHSPKYPFVRLAPSRRMLSPPKLDPGRKPHSTGLGGSPSCAMMTTILCNSWAIAAFHPPQRWDWDYHIRFVPTCTHTRPSYLPAEACHYGISARPVVHQTDSSNLLVLLFGSLFACTR